MQYRLSTLFLIFFMVAASLALFGAWGIYIAVVLLIAVLCLNRAKILRDGIWNAVLIIFIGIICPGLLLPNISTAREAARRSTCHGKLKQIGLALHNYHDANKHLPSANICDKNGKPLFSWRVQILPMMECGDIYNSLKIDEPWNSPHNTKVLSQFKPNYGPSYPYYECPSANHKNNDFTTNYIAVIGPGTAWRENGPVKFSDLPDRGKHTVMAVEVVDSGVHWAEPRDLTVDEALEGLKTGKGLRISSAHPGCINILFADDAVRMLPSKMPISVWRKILAGDAMDFDKILDIIDESAPDMVDVSVYDPYAPPYGPGKWKIILGAIVWLLSVVLLFRRAIKSRRKPEAAKVVE
jgi:hypothetical protein